MSAVQTGGRLEWHNAGPLTTTFTAPAACSTAGVIGSGLANPAFPSMIQVAVNRCDGYDLAEECLPNSERVEEIYSDVDFRYVQLPVTTHYYSPANQCPEDWATVGIVAMNNGSASASGLFRPDAFYQGAPGESTTFPPGDFVANMLTSILEPTETAIACCPSGFSADPYAGCYSNFPVTEIASETGCVFRYSGEGLNPDDQFITETFVYDGVTTTGRIRNIPLPSGWRDTEDASTVVIPLDSAGQPQPTDSEFELIGRPNETWQSGVAQAQPIYLVHGDNDNGGNDTGSNGSGGNGSGGNDDGGRPESAAHTLAPSGWTVASAIMVAWGLSMAAGVGLLASW